MSIYNDKELFKLRDDILAGNVVMVTKDHFNQLESVAVSRSGLLTACTKAHDALLALHVCNQDKSFADETRTLLKAAIDKAKP